MAEYGKGPAQTPEEILAAYGIGKEEPDTELHWMPGGYMPPIPEWVLKGTREAARKTEESGT